MTISKERLLKETKTFGYRQEIIEKVIWLMEILNAIANDSYLATRLALKGGTALNLFLFNLPRLSVDADFNYIGAVDRSIMLKERSEIEFIQTVKSGKGIKPELFIKNTSIIDFDAVKSHPALLWAEMKSGV